MAFNLAVVLSEGAAAAPERTVASFAEGQLELATSWAAIWGAS